MGSDAVMSGSGFYRIAGRSAFLALVGLAAGMASAHATAFCEVKRTGDGFVALRAAPSAEGKRLWRLKAGDMVQIDTTRSKTGGWVAVIYRSEDQKTRHIGWVAARLIEKECG